MLIDDLRRVKEVLLECGWCQGRAQDPLIGRVCIMGAVNIVTVGKPTGFAVYRLDECVRARRSCLAEAIHPYVAHWNDQYGRTFDEVIALIDKAILRQEQTCQKSSQPVSLTT